MTGKIRIGLTGGIGSGKSTVAKMLEELGAFILDADAISRATTQAGGSAIAQVSKEFGKQYIDQAGALDRALMRQLIFSRPSARAELEAIIHPLVSKELAQQVRNTHSNCLVFDVPLLVESFRWRPQLDRVWVVDCLEQTQVDRVRQRNGWDEAAILSVMEAQSPRHRRIAAADAVIFNDGISLDQLQETVIFFASEFGL